MSAGHSIQACGGPRSLHSQRGVSGPVENEQDTGVQASAEMDKGFARFCWCVTVLSKFRNIMPNLMEETLSAHPRIKAAFLDRGGLGGGGRWKMEKGDFTGGADANVIFLPPLRLSSAAIV